MSKKREVKPFIDIKNKNTIDHLSYITGVSIKKIGEDFCLNAVTKENIIQEMSQYFKRDFRLFKTLYYAKHSPKEFNLKADKVRISIFLSNETHEIVYSLAYAMGSSVSKVVTLCIEKSMEDIDFINQYMMNHVSQSITKKEQDRLHEVLDYLNSESEVTYSMPYLINFIVEEIKQPMQTLPDAIRDFIKTYYFLLFSKTVPNE